MDRIRWVSEWVDGQLGRQTAMARPGKMIRGATWILSSNPNLALMFLIKWPRAVPWTRSRVRGLQLPFLSCFPRLSVRYDTTQSQGRVGVVALETLLPLASTNTLEVPGRLGSVKWLLLLLLFPNSNHFDLSHYFPKSPFPPHPKISSLAFTKSGEKWRKTQSLSNHSRRFAFTRSAA